MTARAVAARLAGGVADRWRRRLTVRAVDATGTLAGRSLLVLAPHPDDETFGCGALIARARAAGSRVTVVVATDGTRCATSQRLGPDEIATLRQAELRAACDRLGVRTDDTVLLGYGDGTLAARLPQLTADVAALVGRVRPDVVLLPCAQDQHPDHRALHDAGRAAGGAPTLLGYPVWTWYSAPFFVEAPAAARPRLWAWAARQTRSTAWWRVPTGPHLTAKRAAVAAYVSQTTNYTGEQGWSFLPPRFVALFLGADELFLPYESIASDVAHASY
jgi:LmbE family N-acetylglucosaminyl deacetylase